jgi:hypothetical protein
MPAAIDRLREYHRVGTKILTEFGPGRNLDMDEIKNSYGLGVRANRWSVRRASAPSAIAPRIPLRGITAAGRSRRLLS